MSKKNKMDQLSKDSCDFTCPVCGKVKQVARKADMKTFCSRSCAAISREGTKTRSTLRGVEFECIFKPDAIICTARTCDKCGWNPVVAKDRLDAITEKGFEPKPQVGSHYGDWISVEERLPIDGEQVLAFTHTGKVMSLHCRGGRWRVTSNVQITHWMAMPDAPKV